MAVIRGTPLDDSRIGTAGADRISLLAGDDWARGGGGRDSMLGGDGNDRLFGEAGADTIRGGAGADSAYGGDGPDRILGDDGGDTLDGGNGADSLLGGNGDDTLLGGSDNDRLVGGAGNDRLAGGDGNDTLGGGDGDDRLVGGNGADLFWGGNGSDALAGGADGDRLYADDGDDQLRGHDGDDSLFGGNGDDTLAGGTGLDRMQGGDGADRYALAEGDTGIGAARDIIMSWDAGDIIDLGAIDSNPLRPGQQTFRLVGETARPAAGELGYYRSGADTIIVGNTGAGLFEIALEGYLGPLDADDLIGDQLGSGMLAEVPAFRWYHGCAPTAAASVVAYWDLNGYGDLLAAEGWEQLSLTAFVQDEISSPAHNARFDPTPDDLTQPDPPDTSLADFFGTSEDPLGYGLTYSDRVAPGLEAFVQSRGYDFTTRPVWAFHDFTGEDLVAEIDAGRPLLFGADSNGDGRSDHCIPVFGYEDRGSDGLWYAFYTNWSEEESVQWAEFLPTDQLQPWTVATATLLAPPGILLAGDPGDGSGPPTGTLFADGAIWA